MQIQKLYFTQRSVFQEQKLKVKHYLKQQKYLIYLYKNILSMIGITKALTQDFVRKAPKIELHAHLNGCVRRQTLFEIAQRKQINVDLSIFDLRNIKGAFSIFSLIHQVLRDLQDIRRVSREVLEDFRDQNVAYLELRTTPKSCELGTYTKEQYLNTVIDEIQKFQQQYGDKMQARLLVSIDRGRPLEDAQSTLNHILKLKNNNIIVGLDFSGNPSKSTFKEYEQLLEQARKEGFKITIHVAELEGEEYLQESFDIVNFKPDRLGHFNFYNQDLYSKVRQLNIPIEMCPTSNFYTVNMKSLSEHHFKEFFYQGHTINLNTDDTCVFDTDITQEHFKMIQAFNLSEDEFKSLLVRSSNMIFDQAYKPLLQQRINEYFSTSKNE
ncbi:adenosine/AMP deaminase (macronuclear) [Tetrahymena thermophila SB210]|uniref:Adenosine/AMP deaminase n=1 Tax=Tetrahymena thermophila (strain SB210) TaxID=312017 RepID=I7M003_TETTS|nr:adenosine/AMP deaminase [Tetrahymena thermophila SB210]EAR85237.2 adenosine/AMP deaminase [Tetrahymena thermophila SB210]|eukprot:XP_001032900.2 adenosine/AMP deaminase [Tetrahymena thermophila SB210]